MSASTVLCPHIHTGLAILVIDPLHLANCCNTKKHSLARLSGMDNPVPTVICVINHTVNTDATEQLVPGNRHRQSPLGPKQSPGGLASDVPEPTTGIRGKQGVRACVADN